MLAEAEAARFAPSLRSRGIDPAAARQVALLRDELLGAIESPGRMRGPHAATRTTTKPCSSGCSWLIPIASSNAAARTGPDVMVGGRGVRLGPESVVRDAELYLALDAREDRRAGLLEVQVSLASMVRLEWLEELFPGSTAARATDALRRITTARRLRNPALVSRPPAPRGPEPAADPDEAGLVLAEALRPQAASLFRGNPQAALWLARLDFVRQALPELNWPDFNDDLPRGSAGARSAREKRASTRSRQADFVPFLQSRLTPGQIRELRESAPQSLAIPSGRQVRLTYETGTAADPGGPAPGALRLDRDAARRPRTGPRLAALARTEQSARPDHERPAQLLDDHLSPGEEGPPRPLSQACLAGRPAALLPHAAENEVDPSRLKGADVTRQRAARLDSSIYALSRSIGEAHFG